MHNIDVLVKGKGRCTVQIHPDDAARAGVRDGGLARVSSTTGHVDLPVEVTDAMRPGVVSVPHGWGHDRPGTSMRVARAVAGVNANVLVEARVDPLSGNAVLSSVPVRVGPVSE
jgi:anaerobic selenocysteine-containing dehydrogenase